MFDTENEAQLNLAYERTAKRYSDYANIREPFEQQANTLLRVAAIL